MTTYNDLSAETISDALSHIDSTNRETWWRMAMAVKSELGESGFSVWDDWSQGADNYSARDAKDTWKSVKPHGSVTIATLIYQAQQNGFDLSRSERHVLTADEIEARRVKREAEARAARAEEKRIHGEVARIANLAWNAAEPANDNHPYLVRKQVQAHGLRVGAWPVYGDSLEVFKRIPDTLLVPIIGKDGKITSLQGYFADPSADPDRRYLRDGRKSGGFHIIGTPGSASTVVCEGYATGATIHQATGWCTVVAFDAGNLRAVAELAREMFPQTRLVIAADDDQWTDGNPGMTKATDAANAVRGLVVAPVFSDLSAQPKDFNDMAALDGLEAVCARFHAFDPAPALPVPSAPVPANDNRPSAALVDWQTPLPDSGGGGKPLATIENLAEVCNRLNVTVRYNVISKEEELLVPGHSFLVDNMANASLAWLTSWCARFRMPTGSLGDFVTYLADQNPYNPVANWITSKPWDGKSRLADLYDTITPAEDKRLPSGERLRDVLIRRWMMSAIAAAFNPNGVSAHGILVLQGDQYLGKTKWFKNLVPEDLGVLKDGMILRPDDKDSVKQVCSFWLVELGELDATFRKSDIAALKSFITNQSDVLRRAYARKESHFARRTVFFGSVNPREYLHDPTGNRRYWTIEAKAINLDHGLDMQQVWAEAYALRQSGEGHYLAPEEMAALNHHNEEFTAVDPIEEMLQTRLAWDAPEAEWEWKTATEVLTSIGMREPRQSDATKAAAIIRKMNGARRRRYGGKSQMLVPPKPMGDGAWNDRPF